MQFVEAHERKSSLYYNCSNYMIGSKKTDNPTIPITVSEQIESTRKCYNAGASKFHLHVRNEDESPSSDVNKFKELLVGIEESCPNIIIQFYWRRRSKSGRKVGRVSESNNIFVT